MKKKINIRKLFKRLILVILLLCTVIFYFSNKKLKHYGYSGVWDLISTYSSNSKLSKQVMPTVINLNLSNTDYDFIKERRKVALDRGLQVNDGDNYVDCKVVIDGDTVNGEMRLKGHMTDHLEGDKWSFRVKTKKEIFGMYRFSLQHPGTRNYIYEWIYHQLLKNEDIIYLKYDFVNLKLNDKDLGIYAVEEHFGQHVLNRNNRPRGAIIRWNPSLYWESRIDEYQGIYLNQDYSSFSSSFAEPYDKKIVLNDVELIENYKKAALNLELFRRGEKKTSDVFDVEKMAKFHAIIDLVGGHHSLDWSDVKFYYNSDTKKIEPVGYESFSIRKSESIAGQRILDSYNELQFDYHTQLFSDPVFYEAYINNLERIADEFYLKEFKDKIQEELNEKLGIVAIEWPYRKFNFDGYFENIRLIKNNLDLPKPMHAFIESNNADSINISLAPVSDFPIQIIGIKKKNKTIKLKESFVLSPKAKETVIKYYNITVHGKFTKVKNLKVLAKIPGSSNVFEVELNEYPSYKQKINEQIIIGNESISNLDTTILIVNKDNIISFKNNVTTIKSQLVIPKNYRLVLYPGQKIILEEKLIIKGEMNSHGYKNELNEIMTNGKGEIVLNGIFKATNTQFSGDKLISSNNSELEFYYCMFYDINDYLLKDNYSQVSFNNCSSGNVNTLCYLNESNSKFEECVFKNGKLFTESNGSLILLKRCKIEKFNKISNLDYSSQFYMWSSNIIEGDTLFDMSNTSTFQSYGSNISSFNVGFKCDEAIQDEKLNSTYTLYKTSTQSYNKLEVKV